VRATGGGGAREMARVWVAMSGGVDSSMAAALLVEAGHDVTGVTMRLLSEDAPGGCCPSGSARDAKRVCDLLGVAHYTLDLRSSFDRFVITPFVDGYAEGLTPNPCIECNDRVKFDDLLGRALANGADYLATGHYARIETNGSGEPWLARGLDPDKDQSYFLYRTTREQLEHALFPVGSLTKAQVRAGAADRGLPTATRSESQEACFLAGTDARSYVRMRRPDAFVPGHIVDGSGAVVGRHDGAAGLTIGQRKGVGVSGGEARYVTAVSPGTATVVVGERDDLLSATVVAGDVIWRGGRGPVRVSAQARYRTPEVAASAVLLDGMLEIAFDEPISAVAPGQAVVCWVHDRVVGGGTVTSCR
jgi:tRNA-specific 2-thiouridylase